MRVSDLYNDPRLRGQDVYIVGTGPSLSVFPIDLLADRCCILLNDAHKYAPSLGPVAFSNHLKFLNGCGCSIQVVKGRLKWQDGAESDCNHCDWNDPYHYVFSYRDKNYEGVSHFDDSQLWAEPDHYWNVKGGSVSLFAMQFAALCGVKSITLVGCDCTDVLGAYHPGKTRYNMRAQTGIQTICKRRS